MSRLDDLFPDVKHMSEDELHKLVRTIRADRRIKKETKKKKSPQKKKDMGKLKALLNDMTPEAREAFLRGDGNL